MSKRSMKIAARLLGHKMGRWKVRRYSWDHPQQGRVMYSVCWCARCGVAMFSDGSSPMGPIICTP